MGLRDSNQSSIDKDLLDFFSLIFINKWRILFFVVTTVLLTFYYAQKRTPTYEAQISMIFPAAQIIEFNQKSNPDNFANTKVSYRIFKYFLSTFNSEYIKKSVFENYTKLSKEPMSYPQFANTIGFRQIISPLDNNYFNDYEVFARNKSSEVAKKIVETYVAIARENAYLKIKAAYDVNKKNKLQRLKQKISLVNDKINSLQTNNAKEEAQQLKWYHDLLNRLNWRSLVYQSSIFNAEDLNFYQQTNVESRLVPVLFSTKSLFFIASFIGFLLGIFFVFAQIFISHMHESLETQKVSYK